jgi:cyanate lyase
MGRRVASSEETDRLLEVLRTAIRLRETSFRHIEREMGLRTGYLTRILTGQVALRVTDVLQIGAIINVAPGDLWAAVFPPSDDRLSRALSEIAALTPPRVKSR